MKVKDLIDKLTACDPDAEMITGIWNGKVNTYTVLDSVKEFMYEEIEADFFGTPGAMDERLFNSQIEKFVYIGTQFDYDRQVVKDRHNSATEQHMQMRAARDWSVALERLNEYLRVGRWPNVETRVLTCNYHSFEAQYRVEVKIRKGDEAFVLAFAYVRGIQEEVLIWIKSESDVLKAELTSKMTDIGKQYYLEKKYVEAYEDPDDCPFLFDEKGGCVPSGDMLETVEMLLDRLAK